MLSEDRTFLCPYCGSRNDIGLEGGQGKQYDMVTDCEVCCRPIIVTVRVIGDDLEIEARAENE